MTTYLALDPGLTTGVAWYDTRTQEFGSLEIRGRHALYDYLASDWDFDHHKVLTVVPTVIVERWDVRADTRTKSNQDDPRYIIGYVEGECARRGVPYREQRPVEAKKFATDARLRAMGWYTGGEGHADDAARHLLVALVKDRAPEILDALT